MNNWLRKINYKTIVNKTIWQLKDAFWCLMFNYPILQIDLRFNRKLNLGEFAIHYNWIIKKVLIWIFPFGLRGKGVQVWFDWAQFEPALRGSGAVHKKCNINQFQMTIMLGHNLASIRPIGKIRKQQLSLYLQLL